MVEIVLQKLGMHEGAAATPVPFSPPLEQFYVPSPERIAQTVREIV